MTPDEASQVTRILRRAEAGDRAAADELLPLVYEQLRSIARQHMAQERSDHTLQATALIHEVYLKLVGNREIQWTDRAHFLAVAAKAMRNLLIDHARKRKAGKRGGGGERVTLDAVVDSAAERSIDLLALDEALEGLGALHERQARGVEMRFFGGLTVPEAAQVLGVCSATVDNDWRLARAWLTRQLTMETTS